MFKSFFGKVGSTIKSIPHTITVGIKDTATAILGIGYFAIWAPITVINFYVFLFKSFGEICIACMKGFFGKFKKPVIEAEPVAAEV